MQQTLRSGQNDAGPGPYLMQCVKRRLCSSRYSCLLQAYALSAPPDRLLEDHLMQEGLSVATSAIAWLTPAQLLAVEKELEQMEMTFSFETTAWWLSDVLARARITNNRMSRSGANSW